MTEVTEILTLVEAGDPSGAQKLLPLVYEELRKLAAARLEAEPSGQTLQPTALVHEAYLRLIGAGSRDQWYHRGHFFGAAAEAMRRILVDRARQKGALKRGGEFSRLDVDADQIAAAEVQEDLVALDDALNALAVAYPVQAEVVNLHYFGGLTLREVAVTLEISERTSGRYWTFARAWLRREIERGEIP